jgi:two-component system sensor histidine kinase EvgS
LSPERANLRQLVESVVRVFDGLARQKGLSLLLDLDSGINTDVLIDPLRFKQILSNLTSNAIKFTEHGQVKISLQTESGTDLRQLLLHVRIQDTGIGISAQDQRRLFAPFAQADSGGQQARTGAGLGLVICRSLCEMMGGTLELSSEQGQGTHVHMTFGLTTLEPVAASAVQRENLPPANSALNILVVDDHPANSLLLCQQLEFLGHHCAVAEQGAQGLARWQERPFDVVVTDCNMPIMNGYELTREIRALERVRQQPRCTIWGFTANAQPEEKQRCRDAGMDDCLFKPIGLNSLSERLSHVHPHPGAGPEGETIQSSWVTPQEAFNMGSVSALTGERPEMTRRLLEQLLRSSEEDRLELTALTPGIDHSGLRHLAHRIKGAARIIRATRVIETCEALESTVLETTPENIIRERQQEIEAAMLDLEHALRGELEKAA